MPKKLKAPVVRLTSSPTIKVTVSVVAVIALAATTGGAHAADLAAGSGRAQAEAVLERYVSGSGTAPWPVESVEIHASLPKLAKSGQLEAIRRTDQSEGLTYHVVQVSGDRTVKDQVIVRYLNAQQRAWQMQPAAVAFTPANYKFAYKGMVDVEGGFAYAFRITPRKKRIGLIKGELWLDGESALAIRHSGYFVKSPSLWIKRIAVTQQDALRDGDVQFRLTHIAIETRVVGRAELTIAERPLGRAEKKQPIASSF